jgi:hypothetical protein
MLMKYTFIFPLLLSVAFSIHQATAQTLPESAETVIDWHNLQGAVSRLVQANETKAAALVKAQQDAAALADYWKSYVAGLTSHK